MPIFILIFLLIIILILIICSIIIGTVNGFKSGVGGYRSKKRIFGGIKDELKEIWAAIKAMPDNLGGPETLQHIKNKINQIKDNYNTKIDSLTTEIHTIEETNNQLDQLVEEAVGRYKEITNSSTAYIISTANKLLDITRKYIQYDATNEIWGLVFNIEDNLSKLSSNAGNIDILQKQLKSLIKELLGSTTPSMDNDYRAEIDRLSHHILNIKEDYKNLQDVTNKHIMEQNIVIENIVQTYLQYMQSIVDLINNKFRGYGFKTIREPNIKNIDGVLDDLKESLLSER
jgi:methyl-accepting chemotaxis protein